MDHHDTSCAAVFIIEGRTECVHTVHCYCSLSQVALAVDDTKAIQKTAQLNRQSLQVCVCFMRV